MEVSQFSEQGIRLGTVLFLLIIPIKLNKFYKYYSANHFRAFAQGSLFCLVCQGLKYKCFTFLHATWIVSHSDFFSSYNIGNQWDYLLMLKSHRVKQIQEFKEHAFFSALPLKCCVILLMSLNPFCLLLLCLCCPELFMTSYLDLNLHHRSQW